MELQPNSRIENVGYLITHLHFPETQTKAKLLGQKMNK